jgi:hypothetical protein
MPIFIFISIILSLLGQTQPSFAVSALLPALSVEKIQQGELLDKAKTATLDDFFESWMDRNPNKATEGCWFILYQNDAFIYWGWSSFKILMGSNPTVKEFFQTPHKDIKEKFPNYETVHGNSIRDKLVEVIRKSIPKKAKIIVELGFKASLIDETIVIRTPCSIKHQTESKIHKANYNVILNKNTLALIKLEPI